jgi:DNA-binding IclR family transcriptional regulator
MEYLVEAGSAGVSEVAREVGLSAGTSHRLLATLVAAGWVEQDTSTKKYRPTGRVVSLAQRVRGRLDARAIAHAYLVALGAKVDETANIAVLTDAGVLYVDKVTSAQPFGIEARIGSRLPAYCTALGKVLLSHLDPRAIDAYVEGLTRLRREGARPVPPPGGAFRAELREAKALGYAFDHGEYLPDVFCVAAPIQGPQGNIVAAMSVSVPRSRFVDRRDAIRTHLCATTSALSDRFRELGIAESPGELVSPELASS